MDVRCDRCGTEYEFDDALVSERGTSVKCTNCGHQFKVFRSKGEAAPEQWNIRTSEGRDVVFHSLRELKAAIMGRQILRTDRLARGGGPMRTLGSIPELASFFDDAERAVKGAGARVPTPRGLGGPASQMPLTPERAVSRTWQGMAPAPHQVSVSMLPATDVEPASGPEPPTARRPSSSSPSLPTTGAPVMTAPTPEMAQNDGHRISRFDFHEDETSMGRSRGGALRWVLAVVVLGALGVAGVTFGQQLLGDNRSGAGPSPSASASGAVRELTQQGERALADGDLEGAKEALIKASALGDHDVRVHVLLARLWAMRADLGWLRLKLAPAGDAEAKQSAQHEVSEAVGRARKSADRAAELSPDDLAVVRVKVDALRLADDRAVARALAPRLATAATQPEVAYVLGALDLSESSPPWKGIIERLQLASSAESSPGRARAALVYALASSGDLASARQELERMQGASRPYPLVRDLKRFLDAQGGGAAASASASASARPIDIGSLPPVLTANPAPTNPQAPVPTVPTIPPQVVEPHTGNPGEFSEEELHKKLFGDKARGEKVEERPTKPEPKPEPKPEQKPEQKPPIDTSDLPGVKPP